jgi:uncharacterized damage-inducible protein DinB
MAAAGVAACLCAGTPVQAQMAGADNGKDAKAAGDVAGKSVDGVLSIYEREIVGAAEAMPADKYDFAPKQADFKTKVDFDNPKPVMSFAEEVKHLTQANYGFFGAGGTKPAIDVKAISNLKSKDEIVAALKESFGFAHKVVLQMTAANAFESVDVFGNKTTRAASFAFALAHMGDHYGQLVEYLRMNGIVPPASQPAPKK